MLGIGVEWVLVINQELNMFDITHALKKIGGGTLLDCGGYQPRDESSYASALVLVKRRHDNRYNEGNNPFVVWTAVDGEPDMRAYFVSGHYFDSEKEARDYLQERIQPAEDAHIGLYRLVTLLAALKLEVKGMKRRGKTANQIIKDEFGFKGNRQRVLDQFEAHVNELREQRGLPTN